MRRTFLGIEFVTVSSQAYTVIVRGSVSPCMIDKKIQAMPVRDPVAHLLRHVFANGERAASKRSLRETGCGSETVNAL